MMKKFLLMLVFPTFSFAQNVGINTTTPNATLDVVGYPTDNTILDGIIAPRITGIQLRAKNYTSSQRGALMYVTVPDSLPSGQTINVTSVGYFYFDGTVWQKVGAGASATETDPLAWKLLGNAGTTAGTNFLGTTDNQDLIFKRNNIQAGWLNVDAGSTAFGVKSLPKGNGSYGNTAFGYNVLPSVTYGEGNIGMGFDALVLNTSGNYNLAIGGGALAENVSGDHNIALGYTALGFNNTGFSNIGIGTSSLMNSTTGGSNIAIGSSALSFNSTGSNNTVVGASALQNNSAASGNTAVGANVAYNYAPTATVAANNSFFGYNTGGGLITGVNNTILGANVSGLSSALSNNIIIADGTGARRINVIANGNVGIGTTAPAEKLDVVGNLRFSQALMPAGNAGTNGQLLVSKGVNVAPVWADASTIAPTTAANNGLTNNSGTIQMGGALIQPTTVSGLTAANKMSFTGTGVDSFNINGNTFSVDATNGRVGIGTTAPTATLSVAESVLIGGNISGSTTSDPTIKMNGVGWNRIGGGGATSSLALWGNGNSTSNNNPQMFIQGSSGNVGVNTTAPNSTLTVEGSFEAGYREVTGSYTATQQDHYITYSGVGTANITLPVIGSGSTSFTGRIYRVKNISGVAITLIPSGTDKIRATSTLLSSYTVPSGAYIEVVNNGQTAGNGTWDLSFVGVPNITNVEIYGGQAIIPPYGTSSFSSYGTPDWSIVSMTSTSSNVSGTVILGSLTSGSVKASKAVIVYEYQGTPFNLSNIYPILTAGNNSSYPDVYCPSFVSIANNGTGGKTRLTVAVARVDLLDNTTSGISNWAGTFLLNILLARKTN